jgi:hypothetical protein
MPATVRTSSPSTSTLIAVIPEISSLPSCTSRSSEVTRATSVRS